MRRARRARTSPRARQVWTRAELEKKAPGIDWTALLDAAQLGGAQKFEAYHSNAIPKLAALVALGAARRVEGLAGVPHAQPAGQRPAQGVPRRQLRLQRHGARRNAAGAAARRAGDERGQQRAAGRASARPMSTNISRRRPRPRSRRWSTTSRPPSPAGRGARLDGALDQGRGAEEGRDRSSSASAIPTRWRDYSSLEIGRRRLRQPEECVGLANIGTRSPRSASRWTAPNGGCRRSW